MPGKAFAAACTMEMDAEAQAYPDASSPKATCPTRLLSSTYEHSNDRSDTNHHGSTVERVASAFSTYPPRTRYDISPVNHHLDNPSQSIAAAALTYGTGVPNTLLGGYTGGGNSGSGPADGVAIVLPHTNTGERGSRRQQAATTRLCKHVYGNSDDDGRNSQDGESSNDEDGGCDVRRRRQRTLHDGPVSGGAEVNRDPHHSAAVGALLGHVMLQSGGHSGGGGKDTAVARMMTSAAGVLGFAPPAYPASGTSSAGSGGGAFASLGIFGGSHLGLTVPPLPRLPNMPPGAGMPGSHLNSLPTAAPGMSQQNSAFVAPAPSHLAVNGWGANDKPSSLPAANKLHHGSSMHSDTSAAAIISGSNHSNGSARPVLPLLGGAPFGSSPFGSNVPLGPLQQQQQLASLLHSFPQGSAGLNPLAPGGLGAGAFSGGGPYGGQFNGIPPSVANDPVALAHLLKAAAASGDEALLARLEQQLIAAHMQQLAAAQQQQPGAVFSAGAPGGLGLPASLLQHLQQQQQGGGAATSSSLHPGMMGQTPPAPHLLMQGFQQQQALAAQMQQAQALHQQAVAQAQAQAQQQAIQMQLMQAVAAAQVQAVHQQQQLAGVNMLNNAVNSNHMNNPSNSLGNRSGGNLLPMHSAAASALGPVIAALTASHAHLSAGLAPALPTSSGPQTSAGAMHSGGHAHELLLQRQLPVRPVPLPMSSKLSNFSMDGQQQQTLAAALALPQTHMHAEGREHEGNNNNIVSSSYGRARGSEEVVGGGGGAATRGRSPADSGQAASHKHRRSASRLGAGERRLHGSPRSQHSGATGGVSGSREGPAGAVSCTHIVDSSANPSVDGCGGDGGGTGDVSGEQSSDASRPARDAPMDVDDLLERMQVFVQGNDKGCQVRLLCDAHLEKRPARSRRTAGHRAAAAIIAQDPSRQVAERDLTDVAPPQPPDSAFAAPAVQKNPLPPPPAMPVSGDPPAVAATAAAAIAPQPSSWDAAPGPLGKRKMRPTAAATVPTAASLAAAPAAMTAPASGALALAGPNGSDKASGTRVASSPYLRPLLADGSFSEPQSGARATAGGQLAFAEKKQMETSEMADSSSGRPDSGEARELRTEPPALEADDDAAGDVEVAGTGGGDGKVAKRPRLVWTPELHGRFLSAVNHLTVKNAVPKTILQLMGVDGMTRENVASHLQKYRLYLKRLAGLPANAPLTAATLQQVQDVQQSLQQQMLAAGAAAGVFASSGGNLLSSSPAGAHNSLAHMPTISPQEILKHLNAMNASHKASLDVMPIAVAAAAAAAAMVPNHGSSSATAAAALLGLGGGLGGMRPPGAGFMGHASTGGFTGGGSNGFASGALGSSTYPASNFASMGPAMTAAQMYGMLTGSAAASAAASMMLGSSTSMQAHTLPMGMPPPHGHGYDSSPYGLGGLGFAPMVLPSGGGPPHMLGGGSSMSIHSSSMAGGLTSGMSGLGFGLHPFSDTMGMGQMGSSAPMGRPSTSAANSGNPYVGR